jgi:hypothetical protein
LDLALLFAEIHNFGWPCAEQPNYVDHRFVDFIKYFLKF